MWTFEKVTPDWLSSASWSTPNTYPMTFACWFRCETKPTNNKPFVLVTLGDAGTEQNIFELRLVRAAGGGAGNDFTVRARTGILEANSITIYAKEVVMHAVAVFESTSSRKIYVNGELKGTNTGTETSSGGDAVRMARSLDNARAYDGEIGEVGIWGAALTLEEVEALFQGMPTHRIRGLSLQTFLPLRDSVGSLAINYAAPGGGHFLISNTPSLWVGNRPNVANPWAFDFDMQPKLISAAPPILPGPSRVCHEGVRVGTAVAHRGVLLA